MKATQQTNKRKKRERERRERVKKRPLESTM